MTDNSRNTGNSFNPAAFEFRPNQPSTLSDVPEFVPNPSAFDFQPASNEVDDLNAKDQVDENFGALDNELTQAELPLVQPLPQPEISVVDTSVISPGPIYPLSYAQYVPPSSRNSKKKIASNLRYSSDFFMDDMLRFQLAQRVHVSNMIIDPDSDLAKKLPKECNGYHSLVPVVNSVQGTIASDSISLEEMHPLLHRPISQYRATRAADGSTCLLRRIHDCPVDSETIRKLDNWIPLSMDLSGLVWIKEGFTTGAFGDRSLVLVYAWEDASSGLVLDKWLERETKSSHIQQNVSKDSLKFNQFHQTDFNSQSQPRDQAAAKIGTAVLREAQIWRFVSQICTLIYQTHSKNLALRNIIPDSLIVTPNDRLMLRDVGLLDLLMPYEETGRNIVQIQQEDFLALGHLVLFLCSQSNLSVLTDLNIAINYMASIYSTELKNLVTYLLGNNMKSGAELSALIAPKIMEEIENVNSYSCKLESELCREIENGRLFRLITKLNFILERAEFQMDPHWSETGNRYLLQLFRDYVFHQVDHDGKPILNLAHVLRCLNKLDVGSPERVMLVSRDERSCLVVSYKDLKKCVDEAFGDLARFNY